MVYIWNDPSEVPADFGPSVVTFGNFDGVHRGHQQVLSELIRSARFNGTKAVAVTFDPHPALIHRPESAPEMIMGLQDKLVALGELGLDAILVMKYSLNLASLTPEEFVGQVLVDSLHASHVVIGHDSRFGRGNSGDLDTMKQLGEKFDFDVQVISEFGSEGYPLHDDDGTDRRCSSTWVREALQEGDVATAAAVLGRPTACAARSSTVPPAAACSGSPPQTLPMRPPGSSRGRHLRRLAGGPGGHSLAGGHLGGVQSYVRRRQPPGRSPCD
ncbi:riboflavin biosynthesis protein RibF [Arthrobacter sp. Hiyo4]|nr:riboflavin biosynthesis protein RibF [Arthrobacter sp. Hiyo4]